MYVPNSQAVDWSWHHSYYSWRSVDGGREVVPFAFGAPSGGYRD